VLEARATGAGPETIDALATSPHLRSLTAIALGDALGDDMSALADAEHLGSLRTLHLTGAPPDAVAQLRASRVLRNCLVTG
jgi:hypothetical protein